MTELIVVAILAASLAGLAVIIFRKMPALLALPETTPVRADWLSFFKRIKTLNPFRGFSSEVFLQKVLSRVRILSLRTENKTSSWLKTIRTKAKIRKNLDANYWKEIKKSTKEGE